METTIQGNTTIRNFWICEKCGEKLGEFIAPHQGETKTIWDDDKIFVSIVGVKGQVYKLALLGAEVECSCGFINNLRSEAVLSHLDETYTKKIDNSIVRSGGMSAEIEDVFGYAESKKLFISQRAKLDLYKKISKNDAEILKLYMQGKNFQEIATVMTFSEEHIAKKFNQLMEEHVKPIMLKESDEQLESLKRETEKDFEPAAQQKIREYYAKLDKEENEE